MSNIIDKFNKWKLGFDRAVNNSLENEVNDVVKEVMKEKIQTEVYDKYEPTQYIRRQDNGGLLDDNNIISNVDKNTHTLTVQNITGEDHPDSHVVNVVETGKGYTWKNSNIYKNPFPRPFHKPAEKELIQSGRAKMALLNGLKRNGI